MPRKTERTKIKYTDMKEIICRSANIQPEDGGLADAQYVYAFGKKICLSEIPALLIEDLRKMGLLNHSRIELGQ